MLTFEKNNYKINVFNDRTLVLLFNNKVLLRLENSSRFDYYYFKDYVIEKCKKEG